MNIFKQLFHRKEAKQPDFNEFLNIMNSFLGGGASIPKYDGVKKLMDVGYLRNGTVYSIVNKAIAPNIGVNWQILEVKNPAKAKAYRGMQQKHANIDKALTLKEQAFEEIENPYLNAILKRPNNGQNWVDFETELSLYFLMTGNAYLYKGVRKSDKNNPPIELYSMPAHLTTIVGGGRAFERVRGYEIDQRSGFKSELPAKDVGHLKTFNPDFSVVGGELYGMPPLRPFWDIIMQDNEAVQAMYKAFLNMGAYGVLSGASAENEWTEEQALALKKKWEKAKGSGSYKDLIFAANPVQWTQIGISPVDLAINTARTHNIKQLCNAYGVPAQLMNDAESSTFANVKEARKSLIVDAALPLKEKLKGFFQNELVDEWGKYLGKNLVIDYDLNAYTELSDDLEALFNRAKTADWLTTNEKREATGFEPSDEPIANELLMQPHLVPASMLGMLNINDNE